MKISNWDKYLQKLYYNINNSSAYTGEANLWKEVKKNYPEISRQYLRNWLKSQRTYTLHKPTIKKFKRNKILVQHIDEQWQADLVDLKVFQNENDGFKYLLTVVDKFSKYAWVRPLKLKNTHMVTEAFIE